ncbi:MAG: protein tyrosine phosphatase family protein [Actinobacteria bacterium]|nr:protein tyrosine phosphatase family protein [Actinomycetota bacterium]
MSIDGAFNFRRINEGLTTSGVVTAEQLRDLQRDGYDAVINLLPDTHALAVPDESRRVEELGLDYVYIPVDFDAPTRRDLDLFADAMDAHAGQKLHVHCAANYRVSAFYALYLLRKGWCSDAEADELIHDLWNPSEHRAWKEFMTQERARSLPQ